jgi:hypothetical protein
LSRTLAAIAVQLAASPALASACESPGLVIDETKISAESGGLALPPPAGAWFGWAVAGIGDVDGDGVPDAAVGLPWEGVGGAVQILFLNPDRTVKAEQKIANGVGGFPPVLFFADEFGSAVAPIGDIDGDGVPDLAVGAPGDDATGTDRGAVYLLRLTSAGTVKSYQEISGATGGFTGQLDNSDSFGTSIAALGDLDGDGVVDLAVGAPLDDGPFQDSGFAFFNYGAVWILFLNSDGTVKSESRINKTEGGFTYTLDKFDNFGQDVAALGDIDGDGLGDVAVGTFGDDDGAPDQGAFYVLLLNADGSVKGQQKISEIAGGFSGALDAGDLFGYSLGALGDLDGDGVPDVAAGAIGDDDGGNARGAVWQIFLKPDGTVKGHQKISQTQGGFQGPLGLDDGFGAAIALLGDLDGDQKAEIIIGAPYDDDGAMSSGSAWIASVQTCFESLACTGDLNADDIVDGADLGVLLSAWGTARSAADLDSSGVVDGADLGLLLSAWGDCPR